MSFASKVVTGGVAAKALLMGTLVTILGATSFGQSVLLVLVSATATGIFGILIVLIQVHSEKALHERINDLENKANEAVAKTQEIKVQTQAIAEKLPEKT
jgi:hypothetical protein